MPAHARRVADGTEPVSWAGTGRIARPGDIGRARAAVNADGQDRVQTTAMAQPVQRASDVAVDTPDRARLMPVLPEVSELLPRAGIRRGATVAAVGSTSLVFALIAEAMAQSSWAAVGMPTLNPLAAVEYGIRLSASPSCASPGRTGRPFVRESPVERWLTFLEEQKARGEREREAGSRPMGGHDLQRSIAAADQGSLARSPSSSTR